MSKVVRLRPNSTNSRVDSFSQELRAAFLSARDRSGRCVWTSDANEAMFSVVGAGRTDAVKWLQNDDVMVDQICFERGSDTYNTYNNGSHGTSTPKAHSLSWPLCVRCEAIAYRLESPRACTNGNERWQQARRNQQQPTRAKGQSERFGTSTNRLSAHPSSFVPFLVDNRDGHSSFSWLFVTTVV